MNTGQATWAGLCPRKSSFCHPQNRQQSSSTEWPWEGIWREKGEEGDGSLDKPSTKVTVAEMQSKETSAIEKRDQEVGCTKILILHRTLSLAVGLPLSKPNGSQGRDCIFGEPLPSHHMTWQMQKLGRLLRSPIGRIAFIGSARIGVVHCFRWIQESTIVQRVLCDSDWSCHSKWGNWSYTYAGYTLIRQQL